MFGIVDRYFLLEVSKAFAAIMGVLLLIAVSMLFLRTLEEVNLGVLGTDLVARFVGLQIVRNIPNLLPPAFFIAALVALGRMARDSELIAFSACGMGPRRIYRALFYFALPAALLTAWFSFFLKPWASQEVHQLRAQQQEQAYRIAGIRPGRFYQQEDGKITLYVEEIVDKKRLRNVFVQDRREGETRLVVSASGLHRYDQASGERFVTLLDGRRYEGTPGSADYAIAQFERYNVRLEPRQVENARSQKRSGLATATLLASQDLTDRAELENRISGPVAIFTLTLIAIPLGTTSPRQRASGRMALALLTYFTFFNLQRLAENWLETGATPAWMGSLWYQVLVLFLVYAILSPQGYWVRRAWARLRGSAAT